MLRYEILLLTIPEITEDEARGIEKHLEKAVKLVKGSMISFDRWGKYRLAYPVNKHEYGVYFLVRFDIDKEGIKVLDDIKRFFSLKLQNLIMRDMIARLSLKQSLAYQRPPSLEETPKRDTGSFFGSERREETVAPITITEKELVVEEMPGEELIEEDDEEITDTEVEA